jgi:hypothetical protein
MKNPKDIRYGLIVVDPTQKGENMDILHFVGYWEKPTRDDAVSVMQELASDEEFGLIDIAHQLEIFPAPDEIVRQYIDLISKE